MKEDLKLFCSILWRQVVSLFSILLIISAIASFLMGEKTDGIIIASIMFINIMLGLFQEFKASKASEKLMNLIQAKVYVKRNGVLSQVLVEDLVLDDIVHLVAGSVAPVDLCVLEVENAFVDDSIRTGETLPKNISVDENILAGSSVVSGKIICKVTAIGKNSSLNEYRLKLESVKKWSSFDIFTERVVKYVFVVSLLVLLVTMFFLVFIMGKISLISFFTFAIAMLVGVVPEILPLIVTIILTRESLILSRSKILVKRLSSLEGLGAVRFLLTDKTGTITENKLKVDSVHDANNFWDYSNLISFNDYERAPMDVAYDEALNFENKALKKDFPKIVKFEPFQNKIGYASFVFENGISIARGQISKILDLCNFNDISVKEDALSFESKGMRVIGLASKNAKDWVFSGFVAFRDPIKSTAEDSFNIAKEKGIEVKILTGDSKEVAISVAQELNLLKTKNSVISLEGKLVENLSKEELIEVVVFAKCTPENKLQLIDRYLKLGPVAFLGDGINDALALKRADIGIAVDNASDIAKESSDIILMEKDISPILKSVSTGRKALRNILTYIMYTLAGNAGTFFSLLVASFFYPVLPMLPIQILLNNLLTDLPLMLLITDNPDQYALNHVPDFKPKSILKKVFIFGIISSVFDLIYFQLFRDTDVASFQTGWFVFSVLAELALVFSIRSSRSIFKAPPLSIPLFVGIIVSAILPFFFIYNSFLSSLFKFSVLSMNIVFVLFGMIVVYILINEFAKIFMRDKYLVNTLKK